MARPIPLNLPPRDPRQELRKRLEEAPIEHAEALLDSWELLQQCTITACYNYCEARWARATS